MSVEKWWNEILTVEDGRNTEKKKTYSDSVSSTTKHTYSDRDANSGPSAGRRSSNSFAPRSRALVTLVIKITPLAFTSTLQGIVGLVTSESGRTPPKRENKVWKTGVWSEGEQGMRNRNRPAQIFLIGFDPGRGRWIFLERQNPENDFLRKGSKAVSPVS